MRKSDWRRFVVLSTALALASVACDPNDDESDDDDASCSSLCEDAKDCPNADQGVDCRDQCGQSEALASRADCNGQWDDLIDCIDHVPDICRISSDECMAENQAFSRCMSNYCETHLDDCVEI
jgi:hypothetical protein